MQLPELVHECLKHGLNSRSDADLEIDQLGADTPSAMTSSTILA